MKFAHVVHYLEEINKHTARLEITRLLAELLSQATPHEAQIISYLSLGTLRVTYESTQFNLAEKSVIKIIAQLRKTDIHTIKEEMQKTGDLGSVAAHGTWQPTGEPTLLSIYNQLIDLEKMSGTGSQEERAAALLTILESVDPLSAQYIIRIIIGKLRLGFSDMTLIDALSWMLVGNKSLHDRIEHAYNICADIGHIAAILKEYGVDGLEKISIIVGIPIRPAAAERLPTARDIIDKIGPCIAQPKLDGFRLQIHLDFRTEKKMWFYSRNLQNMSNMFPDLVKALSDLDVETLIAEGEAIVYDEQTGSFVPFQETVKRKRKHGIEEAAAEMPLKLFLFDILYLNGVSLLNKTHHTRRDIMAQLFANQHEQIVSVIGEKHVDTAQELENYFLENIQLGLEGLVAKKPDSHYQPGKRNFNWIKLKRQEEGRLDDTLDCVILGYCFGQGKRASFGIGAFLVGIYDPKKDCFETVAKVGTGLKDADLIELKQKCDAIRVMQQPHNVVCAKELAPDVWVSPEIVCMIRADEITLSPVHSAGKTAHELGYALRFPRFMGYRPDKSATQATTSTELRSLFNQQKNK